jgi:hypothetical protein
MRGSSWNTLEAGVKLEAFAIAGCDVAGDFLLLSVSSLADYH